MKEHDFFIKRGITYEKTEHQEIKSLEEEWRELREAVLRCATEVCGCRLEGHGIRKGEAIGGM